MICSVTSTATGVMSAAPIGLVPKRRTAFTFEAPAELADQCGDEILLPERLGEGGGDGLRADVTPPEVEDDLATQDVVAGTVDFGCNQIVNIAQHVQSGALKAYAVTSDKR